jgi:hypothetical protein
MDDRSMGSMPDEVHPTAENRAKETTDSWKNAFMAHYPIESGSMDWPGRPV